METWWLYNKWDKRVWLILYHKDNIVGMLLRLPMGYFVLILVKYFVMILGCVENTVIIYDVNVFDRSKLNQSGELC